MKGWCWAAWRAKSTGREVALRVCLPRRLRCLRRCASPQSLILVGLVGREPHLLSACVVATVRMTGTLGRLRSPHNELRRVPARRCCLLLKCCQLAEPDACSSPSRGLRLRARPSAGGALEVDIHLRLSHTAVAEVICTVPAAALSTLLKSSRFLTSVLDWRKKVSEQQSP